jgi:hypothetical protein
LKDNKDGLTVDMDNLFHISILNILWQFVTGFQFAHDDPKIFKTLKAMEEIVQCYSCAGDILLAFPKLRHIVPKLTGYGMQKRICEPMLIQEFLVNLQNCRNK